MSPRVNTHAVLALAALLGLGVPATAVGGAAGGPLIVLASPVPANGPTEGDYPWLAEMRELPEIRALEARFPTPGGFTRVPVAADSYGEFLRGLPVRLDRTDVLDYRGQPLSRPAAAVVLLDVGARDVQQCADTILRLHAEWQWSLGRGPEAAYHFTSGDKTTFAAWIHGEIIKAKGRGIERQAGRARARDHRSYRAWLDLVFRYAGTASLHLDSRAVPPDAPLEPGDFFVEPGYPGHAVVLLDVATSPDGRRIGLVGQGFIPAEDLHVLGAAAPAAVDTAWFPLPGPGGLLVTPAWHPFPRSTARRFGRP